MKRSVIYVIMVLWVVVLGAKKQETMQNFLCSDRVNYAASAEVLVTLPITHQDVRYRVNVFSISNPSDSLLPVKYMVERVDTLGVKSFEAYFDGNFYSFSGNKLREYHWAQDSLPFVDRMVKGRNVLGVHKSGMVSVLIPAIMRRELERIAADKRNKLFLDADTVVGGENVSMLKVEEYLRGAPSRYMELVVDRDRKPSSYIVMSSPGAVGEQLLEVGFKDIEGVSEIDENVLIARYPQIFAKYRTNNYGAEALVGKSLPLFTLPSLSGERYIWKGRFNVPTMMVFLRSGDGVNAETINAVKRASIELPLVTETLWIFMDKNMRGVADDMSGLAEDYTTLFNAERFAMQCGVVSTPMVILVDEGGVIRSVMAGYSPNLKAELMQRVLNMTP